MERFFHPMILQKIQDFFMRFNLNPQSRYVIGFSGGLDSVCLVYHLSFFLKDIVLAYFNHELRPKETLETEIRFIQEQAQAFGFHCEIGSPRESLKKRAQREKRSLEEMARIERYFFFETTLEKHNARHLLLAHHQTDHIETLLMQFFQGGLTLKGMPEIKKMKGGRLLGRPLYRLSRSVLEEWQEISQVSFSLDHTNEEYKHKRNQVRHLLVPVLKQIFPGFEQSLGRLSVRSKEQEVFFSRLLEKKNAKGVLWNKEAENQFWMHKGKWENLPRFLLKKSILTQVSFLERQDHRRISERFLDEVISISKKKIVKKPRQTQDAFQLPQEKVKNEFLAENQERRILGEARGIRIEEREEKMWIYSFCKTSLEKKRQLCYFYQVELEQSLIYKNFEFFFSRIPLKNLSNQEEKSGSTWSLALNTDKLFFFSPDKLKWFDLNSKKKQIKKGEEILCIADQHGVVVYFDYTRQEIIWEKEKSKEVNYFLHIYKRKRK